MALHAQVAKLAVVISIVARMWHIDQILVEAGRKAVTHRSLIDSCWRVAGHRTALTVIPALARNGPRFEYADRAPRNHGIGLLGAVVAVIADSARGVLRQRKCIVEQHQRVSRRVLALRVTRFPGPDAPRDTSPFPQAAQKIRIRLIVLHRKFASRIAAGEMRPIHIEGKGQHRIALAPFGKNKLGDIDFVSIAENARVGAVLH